MEKELRYGWDKILGVPGEYEMISKNVLNIDHTYQRQQVSLRKILGYAAHWDWALCGALLVADRDGVYFVMDGQQRLAAACRRSDVDELPCLVYASQGREWEAKVFWQFGTIKQMISPHDLFKAKITEGNPTIIELDAFVRSLGYEISPTGGMKTLNFIGTLSSYYFKNPTATKHAIQKCIAICDGTCRITKDMFDGMFAIAISNIDLDALALKHLRDAGFPKIYAAIDDQKRAMGSTGYRPAAVGILKIANYGRRTKRYELSAAQSTGRHGV